MNDVSKGVVTLTIIEVVGAMWIDLFVALFAMVPFVAQLDAGTKAVALLKKCRDVAQRVDIF